MYKNNGETIKLREDHFSANRCGNSFFAKNRLFENQLEGNSPLKDHLVGLNNILCHLFLV